MASNYLEIPAYGDPNWKTPVALTSQLPATGNSVGNVRVAEDTNTIYIWNGASWIAVATPGAAIALDGLIGDGTASGPGVAPLTLATVNSNVGTFGSSISIPNFTVNGKGLITASGSNVVIAPAGTLTGTTLASNVLTSSLTSVGTITTGTWNGTVTAGFQFITSGTTYTTPTNITTATLFTFTLIGGGGGGGGFSAAGACASGGGGGGGGKLYITGLTPSTTYTVAIGGGGTGGIATTPGNAGSGGNTTLTIGVTTYTAHGGTGSAGGASNVQGGIGGTATNCTINITGQQGAGSADNSPSSTGGGGNAPFGLGLGGASLGASSAGIAGTGFGAGGSGAHGSGLGGGAGTAGCILVEWRN